MSDTQHVRRPILIVGSMAFDDLQFPGPVEDPFEPGQVRDAFVDVVGGSATYSSLSAAAYAPVRLVAVVGEDFPSDVLAQMERRGIDVQGVERASGRTFRWTGRYHRDLTGRDTLDTQLNVFADFSPSLPASYRDTPIVLLGNIHPALQLEVLDQIPAADLVVADTMNLWIETEPETLAEVLRRIDLLVINDEEARQLTGLHNLSRAAAEVLQRGPRRVIIKRGEHGALYFDAEGVFAAPAMPLAVEVDPTGAGDTFAGGICGYLATQVRLDHRAMRRAMVHGTAAASFCVQALGTSGVANLTASDLTDRVGQIQRLYNITDDEWSTLPHGPYRTGDAR